jgi:hypothetical protein
MVALLCFFLPLLTSPPKSRSRIESRECRAPISVIVLQRNVRRRVHSHRERLQQRRVAPSVTLWGSHHFLDTLRTTEDSQPRERCPCPTRCATESGLWGEFIQFMGFTRSAVRFNGRTSGTAGSGERSENKSRVPLGHYATCPVALPSQQRSNVESRGSGRLRCNCITGISPTRKRCPCALPLLFRRSAGAFAWVRSGES